MAVGLATEAVAGREKDVAAAAVGSLRKPWETTAADRATEADGRRERDVSVTSENARGERRGTF